MVIGFGKSVERVVVLSRVQNNTDGGHAQTFWGQAEHMKCVVETEHGHADT